MILSDHDILDRLNLGGARQDELVITPLGDGAIQPSSVDLRLGPKLLIATPDGFREHHLSDDGPYRLHQHTFLLAATLEWVEIPADLVGVLVGKSSRAREGIQVEAAGYVDPGWKGNLTLEIVMLSPQPTWLLLGQRIAQIRFETLSSPCLAPYGSEGVGRYQNSHGPVQSRAVVGRAS